MERDLRATPLYRELEGHFRRYLAPSFGRVSTAADLEPSPDGRLAAFAGTVREDLEHDPASRICLVDLATGEVEPITNGPNDDAHPRWSPDGSRLAFLSDRAARGRRALYLLEAGRLGEAAAGPAVEGTVEFLAWSPDGASILLGVAGEGAELAGVQGSGRVAPARGPAGQEEVPAWVPEVERSDAPAGWRRVWLADAAGRAPSGARPASREGLNVWEACWCGPGRAAAIVSEGPSEEAWYGAALAVIDLESGGERILHRSEVQLGLPAATPSGRRLAVVEALCSDRMVVAGDLLMVDPETGEATRVDTLGVDVTHLAWREEDRLVFAGFRGLATVVGELDAAAGTARELWSSPDTCGAFFPQAHPVPGGEAVALVRSGWSQPPTISAVEGGEIRSVHAFADEGTEYLQGLAGRLQEVSWHAPDGLEIQGLLAGPGGEGPHPLILWVHGGPVSAIVSRWPGGLLPFLVSRGYAVLLSNPRGSSGRGRAFAAMVYGDPGGRDADDLLAGVDAMVERGIADPARIGVMGGSYGGFMSCWLPTRTDRFAASVAVSPVTDWYSQHWVGNVGFWDREFLQDTPGTPGGAYFARSPVMFADRVRTPVLLTAGTDDECTPPGQAVEFFRALREAGARAELAIYPGEGHGVRKFPAVVDHATRVVGWFERHMPAASRRSIEA